jgi:cytochrome b561
MTLYRNTENRYGLIAILLHWSMAIIIFGLLALGLYMTGLKASPLKLKLYGWHKEFGMLVLMLFVVRFTWRIINIAPTLAQPPRWERFTASAVHWAFYGFMFAMPLTGWLITSASGLPVSFFGLFVIPTLVPPNPDQKHLFATIHEWIAYGLIATVVLHVVAAFKHYLINKDDIMQRIIRP